MNNCPDASFNELLIQLCHAYRTRAGEVLGELGLHVGQERILRALYSQDGLTLSQLADQLGVQPPTVTRMARRMGRGGLLTRHNCNEDGRVFRLYLTDEGRALKGRLEKAWAELEAQTSQTLTLEQQESLQHLLGQLRDNLSAQTTLKGDVHDND